MGPDNPGFESVLLWALQTGSRKYLNLKQRSSQRLGYFLHSQEVDWSFSWQAIAATIRLQLKKCSCRN